MAVEAVIGDIESTSEGFPAHPVTKGWANGNWLIYQEGNDMRAVAFVGAMAALSSAGAQLIGIDYDSGRIYNISATTGAVTPRSLTTLTGASDIAYGPDGMHYAFGSGSNVELYKINIDTGAKTLVSGMGLPFTFEGALTFAPNGTAYGTNVGEAEDPRFFSLNVATGSATIVGSIGTLPHDINGMVWSNNALVGIDREQNSLISLDPTTGGLTYIKTYNPATSEPNLGAVGGMCMFNGEAYFATAALDSAFPGDNSLWKVNLANGNATRIGPLTGITGFGISGLTIIPEPASICMLGAGLLLLVRRCTRKGERR